MAQEVSEINVHFFFFFFLDAFFPLKQELHIEAKVVHLLSSLDVEIQQLCASILLNIINNRPERYLTYVGTGWQW